MLRSSHLQFDDIATTGRAGSISSYSYLTFREFSVVDTTTAVKLELIEQSATDCASSSPNALFGPRANHSLRPQFASDAATLRAAGISTFFNLKRLSFKPLDDIPPNLLVSINAWEIVDGEAWNVYTYWTPYKRCVYQRMERIEFDIFETSRGDGM
ncbi:hypothetical protein BJX62DRAFT_239879 [Aspergillus germanicus]